MGKTLANARVAEVDSSSRALDNEGCSGNEVAAITFENEKPSGIKVI